MKIVYQKNKFANTFLCIICITALLTTESCKKIDDLPSKTLKVTTVATGLAAPIGLEKDDEGNIWVAETGNGSHNSGRVSIITCDGKKYDAITGFPSVVTGPGEVEGPSHLLLHNGWLYVLGAKGMMYKAHVASFKPGDEPLQAYSLPKENIGKFVLAYPFKNNTHETHPYNLTLGPDGDIYITDAAANAILRRSKKGKLSVLAEVPGVTNPTPVGPPVLESVPTGVLYDGKDLLVSTLIGFPFPPGTSVIYKVSLAGNVSIYQKGFTSLVDIAQGTFFSHLVVQHGIFGATGFAPNSGAVLWVNGSTVTKLKDGLNLPTAVRQVSPFTWYVTSLADGSVLKLSYL